MVVGDENDFSLSEFVSFADNKSKQNTTYLLKQKKRKKKISFSKTGLSVEDGSFEGR